MVRYNRFLQISLTALVSAFLIFSAASAAGKSKKSKKQRVYRVTITNVTKGQIFSPPLLATHEAGFGLFTPGTAASPALAKLAEDGGNKPRWVRTPRWRMLWRQGPRVVSPEIFGTPTPSRRALATLSILQSRLARRV